MFNSITALTVALAIGILGSILVTEAHGGSRSSLSEKINSEVDETKKAIGCDKRYPIAQKIFEDVSNNDPSSLSDTDIKSIISLLDLEDDCVNIWTSAAIGIIGDRAKAAIPKLREALAKVECSEASQTAEEPIRRALKGLGVETVRPDDCRH